MNEIKIFENEELGLKVRAILNPDGSISISAEDAAIGFGWTQAQVKNGKQYTSIRWETLNGYCEALGFPNKLGKGDYIPESLYYLLGMKANNERARKYQKWLAMEVIPSIRKTGSYSTNDNAKEYQQEQRSRYSDDYLTLLNKMLDTDTEHLKIVASIVNSPANEANQKPSIIPKTEDQEFSFKTYNDFRIAADNKATQLSQLRGYTSNKRSHSEIFKGMTSKGVSWGAIKTAALQINPYAQTVIEQLAVLPLYQKIYFQVADELLAA